MVVLVTWGEERVAVALPLAGAAVLVGALSDAEPVVYVTVSVTTFCAVVEVMRRAPTAMSNNRKSADGLLRPRPMAAVILSEGAALADC